MKHLRVIFVFFSGLLVGCAVQHPAPLPVSPVSDKIALLNPRDAFFHSDYGKAVTNRISRELNVEWHAQRIHILAAEINGLTKQLTGAAATQKMALSGEIERIKTNWETEKKTFVKIRQQWAVMAQRALQKSAPQLEQAAKEVCGPLHINQIFDVRVAHDKTLPSVDITSQVMNRFDQIMAASAVTQSAVSRTPTTP